MDFFLFPFPGMGTWASPEDVAQHYLRVATGHILENTGFTSTSDESLNLLSDVMRRFIKKLCDNSKFFAEHAGRSLLTPDDLTLAFRRMKYSSVELHDYLSQVGNIGTCKPVCRFPVPRSNCRPLYAPQPSAKELETRPDHIPSFFQAAHPEWTREGADYLAVMKPSTSADKKGAAPDFPSFTGLTAKDLGLTRRERRATPPLLGRSDDSSATGIRSSANSAIPKHHESHPRQNGVSFHPCSAKKKVKHHIGKRDRSLSSSPLPPSLPVSPPLLNKRLDDHSAKFDMSHISPVKEEKPMKFKPSNSSRKQTPTKVSSQAPTVPENDGGLSPMPVLERGVDFEEPIIHETAAQAFTTKQSSDADVSSPVSASKANAIATPPYIADDVLAANMGLFATLKEEAEKERVRKLEKEKERDEKLRKKEKSKLKKQEEQRKRTEKKKKEAKENAKSISSTPQKVADEEVVKLDVPQSNIPNECSVEDPASLKIVISNPHSEHASSAFSPPTVALPSSVPPTPSICSDSKNENEDDSDTTPFFDASPAVTLNTEVTTFPLNMSLEDSPVKSKKKKSHEKDRDVDSSRKEKNKKKEKEHKKKKRKREKEEIQQKVELPSSSSDPVSHDEPKITLKIRLGDQTPNRVESSPIQQEAPMKFKFKNLVPDEKREEKVPPLRIGMSSHKESPATSDEPKRKLVTKAELKAPPSFFVNQESPSKSKEEKKKRKEERRRREQEELARFERERVEKERVEKERAERERIEVEKRRREEEEERERPKSVLPPPVVAYVSAGSSSKSKSKKTKHKGHTEPKSDTGKKASVEEPEDSQIWICPGCSVAWTEDATMVCCDMCDKWFHWHCVGLLVAPEDDVPWFCQKCAGKRQKKPEKRSFSKSEKNGISSKKKRKV